MPNPEDRHGDVRHRQGGRRHQGGKVEYKTNRTANVHLIIGKKSSDEKALLENYLTVVEEILRAKASSAKGQFVKSVSA